MSAGEPVTAPLPLQADAAPVPRRRRRWPWVVLVAVILLAVVAAVVAELVARSIVPQRVRETVTAELGLPAGHPMDVGLGGGLLVPQLIAGRLDDLRIASDDVPLPSGEGVTADAEVRLNGVPLRDGATSGAGGAELRFDRDDLEVMLGSAGLPPALEGAELALAEPDVVLSHDVPLLGASIPIEISLAPGAADGDLTFEPTGASVGGAALSLDQLAAMAGTEVGPVPVCLADRLPAGLTLTDVAVDGQELVASLDIAPGTLGDPALLEPGTCG
ncbi:DUF2993 domain-containing protein [Microbacterium sp. NPDC096154]|uniref:LmeA family phospholipid-binding protein n=1 Tax=Microbacterium sp. NPDC096154 TaxID=3155549 RepID=UPI00332CDF4D